jgi:N-acetyl-alpha-D-glucosaminyl L-malate synthase BshA
MSRRVSAGAEEAARARPLRVGIACFSTFGGSGVVASEAALSLAARGHTVHLFSDERPGRLAEAQGGVQFHRVELRAYPQLRHGAYPLALTSKIVEVARRDGLDVVHAHYAIPHAISAYLARQVLAEVTASPPAIVTTLHGTDTTLVGNDPSFLPLTRFSIEHSDAVTAPSAWLAEATYRMLEVSRDRVIEVIPNFVDAARFTPAPPGEMPAARPTDRPPVLIHVSNFRALKRAGDVIEIWVEARRRRPAAPPVLWLVGDGPDHQRIQDRVRGLELSTQVQFLGERIDLPQLLRQADLFLLPSESESFGLAALEAMACGVPVVASRVGGIPEVVTDGETGLLAPVGDVATMAAQVVRLLADDALRARMGHAARERAVTVFPLEPTVAKYEALYRRLLAAR